MARSVTTNRRQSLGVLLATLASAALTGLVFVALGVNPIAAFAAMLEGAFGSDFRLGQTLVVTTPLALTALAAAIPFRAGLWNVGGEGQMYAGAIAAVSVALGMPSGVSGPVVATSALVIGVVAGAGWGAIAGLFKAGFGANEVIVTLMLSFVAIGIAQLLINGVWTGAGISGTSPTIPTDVGLMNLWPGTPVGLGEVLGVVAITSAAIMMARTRLGFGLRTIGMSPDASRLAGFSIGRLQVYALAIGGGFAGLAGAINVVGINGLLARDFSPGYGFMGIAVALIAGLRPLLILPVAFLYAALLVGGYNLPVEVGISTSASLVVQAVLVLSLLALGAIRAPSLGALGRS